MSTPQFSNADISDIEEEISEEQAEEQREASKATRLANKISNRREQKTIHVEVEGEEIPFTPPAGEIDEIMDMMMSLQGKNEDDLTEEEYSQYKRGRTRIDEILADKCKLTDETQGVFTEEWWNQNFTSEERGDFVGQLAQGGVEGNEAGNFRQN